MSSTPDPPVLLDCIAVPLPVDEALITFPLPTVDAFKALLLLALLKTAMLAG